LGRIFKIAVLVTIGSAETGPADMDERRSDPSTKGRT
jgi:hypothetical protein